MTCRQPNRLERSSPPVLIVSKEEAAERSVLLWPPAPTGCSGRPRWNDQLWSCRRCRRAMFLLSGTLSTGHTGDPEIYPPTSRLTLHGNRARIAGGLPASSTAKAHTVSCDGGARCRGAGSKGSKDSPKQLCHLMRRPCRSLPAAVAGHRLRRRLLRRGPLPCVHPGGRLRGPRPPWPPPPLVTFSAVLPPTPPVAATTAPASTVFALHVAAPPAAAVFTAPPPPPVAASAALSPPSYQMTGRP